MTQLIVTGGGRRHRRYHRWSAGERTAALEAFRQSGLSAVAFCRAAGIPLATFALWKRDARRGGEPRPTTRRRAAFARVTVVPAAPVIASESAGEVWRPDVRIMVRSASGHEAALEGVDGATAMAVVALVLEQRR